MADARVARLPLDGVERMLVRGGEQASDRQPRSGRRLLGGRGVRDWVHRPASSALYRRARRLLEAVVWAEHRPARVGRKTDEAAPIILEGASRRPRRPATSGKFSLSSGAGSRRAAQSANSAHVALARKPASAIAWRSESSQCGSNARRLASAQPMQASTARGDAAAAIAPSRAIRSACGRALPRDGQRRLTRGVVGRVPDGRVGTVVEEVVAAGIGEVDVGRGRPCREC